MHRIPFSTATYSTQMQHIMNRDDQRVAAPSDFDVAAAQLDYTININIIMDNTSYDSALVDYLAPCHRELYALEICTVIMIAT